MNSYIQIEKLILVGIRKNYVTTFKNGLNIIYGDSDTGKSSILEFINYLLGSNDLELADEVSSSTNYSALQIAICDEKYTIIRDIYDKKSPIEVYPCKFSEKDHFFPKHYQPNFQNNHPTLEFYSDFLLERLGYPKVKIKESPSKSDSKMKRLSFRNIFKYCYLNQDDVGSKRLLNLGEWSRFTTNKETFKYIFNLLNLDITELNNEIAEKTKESNELKNQYKIISEFLRETGYETNGEINDSIDTIDSNILFIKGELSELNQSMIANSENYNALKSYFIKLSREEKALLINKQTTNEKLDKYYRLKNDYNNDIKKTHGLIIAKRKIGLTATHEKYCPICNSELEPDNNKHPFTSIPTDSLEDEIKSLKRNLKNLLSLIESETKKQKNTFKVEKKIHEELNKIRKMLDTETKEMITPYLTQRDTLIKRISDLEKTKEYKEKILKIRNQHDNLHKNYEKINKYISQLNEKLDKISANTPDILIILEKLGNHLKQHLDLVKIYNPIGISIDEKDFLPVVRHKNYERITSGGLRTIVSIGHMLGILRYSLENEINHPKLLMIDTVGKYLGKTIKGKYLEQTNIEDDIKEGMSDSQKYNNLYESIMSIGNL